MYEHQPQPCIFLVHISGPVYWRVSLGRYPYKGQFAHTYGYYISRNVTYLIAILLSTCCWYWLWYSDVGWKNMLNNTAQARSSRSWNWQRGAETTEPGPRWWDRRVLAVKQGAVSDISSHSTFICDQPLATFPVIRRSVVQSASILCKSTYQSDGDRNPTVLKCTTFDILIKMQYAASRVTDI